MPENNFEPDKEVIKLSVEIAKYLTEREGAADTFEGLVSWWLFRQRFVEVESKVRLAVEYLCHQGVIQKREMAGGSTLYMAKAETKNT